MSHEDTCSSRQGKRGLGGLSLDWPDPPSLPSGPPPELQPPAVQVVKCPVCDGMGWLGYYTYTCHACTGKGYLVFGWETLTSSNTVEAKT